MLWHVPVSGQFLVLDKLMEALVRAGVLPYVRS